MSPAKRFVLPAREIEEELGSAVTVGAELFTVAHPYPERTVELHFFACELKGEPRAVLGQEMRWVAREALGRLDFPPADAELIQLLTRGMRAERRCSRSGDAQRLRSVSIPLTGPRQVAPWYGTIIESVPIVAVPVSLIAHDVRPGTVALPSALHEMAPAEVKDP